MDTILFLHGWGGDSRSFALVEKYFSGFYKTISPSMPCPPDEVWTLDDYVVYIENILHEQEVTKCHVIAHSFGARVAVLLGIKNPELIDKMIIADGAGLRPRFSFRVWLKIKLYKIKKMLFKNAEGGSRDYRKLSPNGKVTFRNIIKRDLSAEIGGLNIPTLLIYGGRDRATPPYMAKRWVKLCPVAELKIYKNCGHFAYLDDTARFINDARGFLAAGREFPA
jgi:pimeloyl-ACP methyl ester carboxylesterase